MENQLHIDDYLQLAHNINQLLRSSLEASQPLLNQEEAHLLATVLRQVAEAVDAHATRPDE